MPVILNVRVDNLTLNEARKKARNFLRSAGSRMIFTPNPEIIVKAQKDEYFNQVLNKGNLNLCDGSGLTLVSGVRRIPGVDFMLELCQIAEEENKSVFLLGSASDEIAKKTAEELIKKNPLLKIVGHFRGPIVRESTETPARLESESVSGRQKHKSTLVIDETENENIIQQINASGAEVLFVAFGMGKQEKWIAENLPEMPNVKIAIGVGGSFDYISVTVRRAPCWMRKIGLEWLYRLFRQPSRLFRIFNATAGFLSLVIIDKLGFKK